LERAKPYPPLATLQAAEMLRQAGHSVAFFDSMLAEGVDDYVRRLDEFQPQIVVIYEDTFNFLSKMCLASMRQAACHMAAAAQRIGARVIAAGPDVGDSPLSYLAAGADLTLLGEGLSTLLQVLSRLASRIDAPSLAVIDGLSGIAALRDGKVATGCGSQISSPIQATARAAWDLVDMDLYRDTWTKAHGYFSLNMAASRGCSFRCSWCAKPTWGNHYLRRDPNDVAGELSYLKRTFAPDHIWFADDIFGFRVDWVTAFAAAVRTLDAQVTFTVQSRADLISDRMAAALHDAGCGEVWLGAESGSQRILDAMNKGTRVEDIVAARRRLAEAGIRVGFFIQLGYLTEQWDDILATRELLENARPDEIGVSVAYPLPGTKFHDLVRTQLGPKTRWYESDDLAMMFHGTYSSDFYRRVRNLLHEQVSTLTYSVPDSVESAREVSRQLNQSWQKLCNEEHHYRTAKCAATATRTATATG
jgi:anaerobic magnesium-protoporphyrin IX monomethyl ester cyclase